MSLIQLFAQVVKGHQTLLSTLPALQTVLGKRPLDNDNAGSDGISLSKRSVTPTPMATTYLPTPFDTENTAKANENATSSSGQASTLSSLKETIEIPSIIRGILMPHQWEAAQFVWSAIVRDTGAILADSMGLGKTLSTCCAVYYLHLLRPSACVALICPASVLSSWQTELGPKWGFHVPCRMVIADDNREETVYEWGQEGGVLLIGYEMFQIMCCSEDSGVVDLLRSPEVVILDEGHRLRTPNAAITKALGQIKTKRRIILTGYPLQNNLLEYWHMVNFVAPSLLPPPKLFEWQFVIPINNALLLDATEQCIKFGRRRIWLLREKLKGLILRRGPQLLASMIPQRTELVLEVCLSPLQHEMYTKLVELCRDARDVFTAYNILGFLTNSANTLCHYAAALMNNPSPILTAMKSIIDEYRARAATDKSGKLEILKAIVKEALLKNECVVVFSRSLKTLDEAAAILKPLKKDDGPIRVFRFDGSTSGAERSRLVDGFNAGEADVFCLSTKAGGEGISLTRATRVVQFDVCWNPSHDVEASYRVYRLGQTAPVYIYRLIAHQTVESVVFDRQIFKQSLFRAVVDAEPTVRQSTRRQLVHLFTQPPEYVGRTQEDMDTITRAAQRDDLLYNIVAEPDGPFSLTAPWLVRVRDPQDLWKMDDDYELQLNPEERALATLEYFRETDVLPQQNHTHSLPELYEQLEG